MLPSTDAVLAAWPFLSRRFHIDAVPDRRRVGAALRLATDCAASEGDEPAALFYGFARYPRAIPGAWRVIGERLATAHAAKIGLDLAATAEELGPIRFAAATGRLDWPGVRDWFAARLRPL